MPQGPDDQILSEEHAWERPIGRLSAEAIREYKEISKAKYGIELSDAEAEEQRLRLLESVLKMGWIALGDGDTTPTGVPNGSE